MNRRGLLGPLWKSLAFVVVTVVATGMLALTIAQTGGGGSVTYRARFTDASGLRDGDSVRIAVAMKAVPISSVSPMPNGPKVRRVLTTFSGTPSAALSQPDG